MATVEQEVQTQLATRAERERARLAAASRARYAAGSEIGELPPVQNPVRRKACERDLHLFLATYFPYSTGISPFGSSQTLMIQRIEHAILNTGIILNAMPRGFVKSTISENAMIWAAIYGHRQYGVIFAATKEDASEAIASIKSELFDNDLLYADFPEVCFPIRHMECKPQRCISQTYRGVPTRMHWSADDLVLPSIAGSKASGGIIRAKGLTGASRGMRFKRPDGVQARPDWVIIDDPQTDESAVSPTQTEKRLQILEKSIFRTGGHGKQVAAVINATKIAEDDLVDQLADHKKHPEVQATTVKMMPRMPSEDVINQYWLGKYAEIRNDYDPDIVGDQDRAHKAATEYYRQNQQVMDDGAVVSWENIPLEINEISAIQHAMNIFVTNEAVFASECQNEPLRQSVGAIIEIQAEEVRERRSGIAKLTIPEKADHVVFHMDVHKDVLTYAVVAARSDFTGWVVDYGTFPEQPSLFFRVDNIKRPLQAHLGVATPEEAITEGVKCLVNELCGRDWLTPDGRQLAVSTGLVDVGYKESEVAQGIRLSDHARIIFGSRGIGITPLKKPFTAYDTSPNRVLAAGFDVARPRWIMPKETIDGTREIQFDTNFYKSLVAARLSQKRHHPGEWSLFGNAQVDHSAFVSHLMAERPQELTGNGRTVIVWPNDSKKENHWWDNLVGCAVAITTLGIRPPGRVDEPPKKPTTAQTPKRPQPAKSPMIRRPDGKPFFSKRRMF